jgi:hypothetical protein
VKSVKREHRGRRKGREFERAVQLRLVEVFGGQFVRRGVKARGGHSAADVVAPGVWVECKAQQRANPRGALRQAEGGGRAEGRWPVAVCKDDGKPPLAMMSFEDFLALLREWHELRVKAR